MAIVGYEKLWQMVKEFYEDEENEKAYKRSRHPDQGHSDSKQEECEKHSERIIA